MVFWKCHEYSFPRVDAVHAPALLSQAFFSLENDVNVYCTSWPHHSWKANMRGEAAKSLNHVSLLCVLVVGHIHVCADVWDKIWIKTPFDC
jgi:hypothetical protein